MGVSLESKLLIGQKLKLVENYKLEGKYLHAIQICSQLLSEHPDETDVHLFLAELYELSGNLDSSFQILDSYLEKKPADDNVKLFYGQLLLKNFFWDRAIKVFSEFVPQENPIVLFFMGYSYFMLKDFEMARINFLSFLSMQKGGDLAYEANLYLSKIEIEMNDFEQALRYAKQSEILYSTYWELYLIYAICYSKLGMDVHAITSIEKAIKLNPKALISYSWAGKIFLIAGDYRKAEKHLIKVVNSSEEFSSEDYSNLGEVYLKMNNEKSALNYFNLALKLDPDNKIISQNVREILKKMESKISNDAI